MKWFRVTCKGCGVVYCNTCYQRVFRQGEPPKKTTQGWDLT